jgi:hypothetical protein
MPSFATVARFENLTKRFWIYNIKKRSKRPSKWHLETTETPILNTPNVTVMVALARILSILQIAPHCSSFKYHQNVTQYL